MEGVGDLARVQFDNGGSRGKNLIRVGSGEEGSWRQ